MAGPGEALGSLWPPLANCHTPMSSTRSSFENVSLEHRLSFLVILRLERFGLQLNRAQLAVKSVWRISAVRPRNLFSQGFSLWDKTCRVTLRSHFNA
jgi:hypothetical protein